MKLARTIFILYVVASFFLGACGFSTATGPQAWIDKPLDNTTLPLAPIFIMAHASDSEGIASMDFYVNGQLINSAIPVGGAGVRFGEVETQFAPTDPGEYRIEVIAHDSNDNIGSPAFAKITISGEELIVPPAGDQLTEPPVTVSPPTEPPTTQAPPVQPPPSGDVNVSFYASPATVNAGNCTTLHWDVEGTDKVYWNGNFVYFRGMDERCPCETETHKLGVVKPDGSTQDYWATINVTGSCSAPPTDPPPADVIIPAPIDTTPPSFYNIAAGPNPIYLNGCSGFDRIVTVAAVPIDESDISNVTAYWIIGGGESSQVTLSKYALGYGADIGPVSTTGIMSIYFTARDTAGNTGQSKTINVTVKNCIN